VLHDISEEDATVLSIALESSQSFRPAFCIIRRFWAVIPASLRQDVLDNTVHHSINLVSHELPNQWIKGFKTSFVAEKPCDLEKLIISIVSIIEAFFLLDSL
jgi:hypothetical protein